MHSENPDVLLEVEVSLIAPEVIRLTLAIAYSAHELRDSSMKLVRICVILNSTLKVSS